REKVTPQFMSECESPNDAMLAPVWKQLFLLKLRGRGFHDLSFWAVPGSGELAGSAGFGSVEVLASPPVATFFVLAAVIPRTDLTASLAARSSRARSGRAPLARS